MRSFLFLFALFGFLLAGCGEDAALPGTGDDPGSDTAPVLTAIGNRTVTQGGQALSFFISATDPNGSTLNYSMDGSAGIGVNPETLGAQFNDATLQFTWDYGNSPAGDYYVLFKVENADLEFDTETVRIRILDSSPVLSAIGDKTVSLGGQALTFTISATDPNNLSLVYSMNAGVGPGSNPETSGASFNADTRTFSWDYSNSNATPGNYNVQFTVTNSDSKTDSETIRITVLDGSPILNAIGDKTVTQGGPAMSFTVSASDPNNLSLTYSMDASVGPGLNPQTAGASFNTATRTFSWDYSNATVGDYNVQFTVTNPDLKSASETIRITVQEQPSGDFNNGLAKYGQNCESCHGPGGRFGSQTAIQCIDSATFDEKINGGSMSGYASSWSTQDEIDVLYYLNNVEPTRC